MAKGYLYDNGDELISREDVNEVPDSSTAHAGDILELDSNKKPKWTTPESELPSTGSASAGDVLSLDSDKKPVWSAPSGGGGNIPILAFTPGEDIDGEYVNFYIPGNEEPLTFSQLKELGENALIYTARGVAVSCIFFGDVEDDGVTYHVLLGKYLETDTVLQAREISETNCTENQTRFAVMPLST